MLTLREQGYEVGDPVAHSDGFTRVDFRSHDVSAWWASVRNYWISLLDA